MSDLPEQLGGYLVEQELGRGGMGVVYLARDPRLDRQVAIKMLGAGAAPDAESLGRFEREARTLASLNHPNVAAIYGLDEHEGKQLLILEYIPGTDLARRIYSGAAMSVDEALLICTQVAAGLEAAHERGIVHRDLKPGNIRLRSDGVAKVLDFGLAKPSGEQGMTAANEDETYPMPATELGRVMGTAGYMSPEQARGDPVDKRTDIWALGVVLYECLTSSRAFPGRTAVDAMVAVLEREPDYGKLPPSTPPRVLHLLRRCLEKDVKRRLRDIGDARIELDEAIARPGELGRSRPSLLTPKARMAAGTDALIAEAEREAGGDGHEGAVDTGSATKLGFAHGLHRAMGSSGNLGEAGSAMIGRESEAQELVRLAGDHRLVTVVGPAGVGKSRLAHDAAYTLAKECRDGAWRVDLSLADDPSRAVGLVASVLGVQAGESPNAGAIAETLAPRELILLLDNADRALGPARELCDAVLTVCPETRVLVTSGEAVGHRSEIVLHVQPLAVPEAEAEMDLEELSQNPSVRLFCDRAAAAKPGFRLEEANAAAVAEICRRLDGLPLAIELAASRVKLLTAEQVASRLEDRFRLLRRSGSSGPRRQQTLEAAIAWSVQSLDDDERSVLRRLSVFRGGCTLEGAESVCGADYGDGRAIDDWRVLDILGQLVNKSLVLVDEPGEAGDSNRVVESRYRLTGSVREYAAGLLAEDERRIARRLHAAFVADLADAARPRLAGPEQRAWFHRLDQEHENCRVALDAVLAGEADLELGQRIAAGLHRYWASRGYIADGREYLLKIDTLAAAAEPTATWAQLRAAISWLLMTTGDLPSAIAFGRAGLEIARSSRDRGTIADLANTLGAVCHGEMLPERAADHFEEALAIRESLGNPSAIADTLIRLAETRRHLGQPVRAGRLLRRAAVILAGHDDSLLRATLLLKLGWLELGRGDVSSAARNLAAAARLLLDLGVDAELPEAVELAACLAVSQGRCERAGRLFGAAAAARERLCRPAKPADLADTRPWMQRLEAEGEDAAMREAFEAGHRLRLRRAVRYSLDLADQQAAAVAEPEAV